MKRIIYSLSVLAFALYASATTFAQKPTDFEKKTASVDKIKARWNFPAEGKNCKKGTGYSANVELLDPKPKKVALVSFYLYDPACGESKKGGNSVVTTYSASIWRTPDDIAQTHVDGFYSKSIDALKAGFEKYGIDLQTPSEFLDNEDKKNFYNNFVQESAKNEKTSRTQIGGYVQATVSTIKVCPSEESYRPFFVANEPRNESQLSNFVNMGIGGANRKMTSSLGYDLAKGLDVDAVVVCYIITRKPKKKKENYVVDAVNLFMFGPNPKGEGPDDKNRGQFYCGTRYFAKQLEFSSEKAGVTTYDHIGNVMTSLSDRLCNWVINKEK